MSGEYVVNAQVSADCRCKPCIEFRVKTLDERTESYWRGKIAGELDGLPRFGLIWDERLGYVIGADINGNYISRADAIAIARGGERG